MRFVPSFPSDDREHRLMHDVEPMKFNTDLNIDAPKDAKISPEAKEATQNAIYEGGKKLVGQAGEAIKEQYNNFRGAVENLGDYARNITNDTQLQKAGEWLENATDIRSEKKSSPTRAPVTAPQESGQQSGNNKSPEAPVTPTETQEAPLSEFEQKKLDQLHTREDQKFEAAGSEWSTLDVGISDDEGSSYIYKKVNVGGADMLVAYAPGGGLQYLNAEKQWLPVDKNNQEMMDAVGTLDYNATIVQEMEAAEKTGKGKEYMEKRLQHDMNRNLETRFLKDAEADEDWLERNKDNKMWKGQNKPILDALLKEKSEEEKTEEEAPKTESETPAEETPEEGEKPAEEKEEAEETPEARAERILTDTQKKLDELDQKYGEPEEKEDEKGTAETTAEKEKVQESEEKNETDAERRSRLFAEVRGAKPEMKTVDAVRSEKKDQITAIDTKLASDSETLQNAVTGQEEKVAALQAQAALPTLDLGTKTALSAQLAVEMQNLDKAKTDLQTLKDNADKAKKNLEEDGKMLDEIEKETTKAADRTDKRLDAMGTEFISTGEEDIGKGAQGVKVEHDGSFGFKVEVPADLISRLDAVVTEEQEKELNGDNPAVVLGVLDALLTQKKEAK